MPRDISLHLDRAQQKEGQNIYPTPPKSRNPSPKIDKPEVPLPSTPFVSSFKRRGVQNSSEDSAISMSFDDNTHGSHDGQISNSPKPSIDDHADLSTQRERELLWKVLNEPFGCSENARPNPHELKEYLEAMKRSIAVEEKREHAKLGIDLSADFSTTEDTSEIQSENENEASAEVEADKSKALCTFIDRMTDAKTLDHRAFVDDAIRKRMSTDGCEENYSQLSSDGNEAFTPDHRTQNRITESVTKCHSSDTDTNESDHRKDATSYSNKSLCPAMPWSKGSSRRGQSRSSKAISSKTLHPTSSPIRGGAKSQTQSIPRKKVKRRQRPVLFISEDEMEQLEQRGRSRAKVRAGLCGSWSRNGRSCCRRRKSTRRHF